MVKRNKQGGKLTHVVLYSLRRYFFSGLAVIFPLFITIYIIIVVFRFGDKLAGAPINSFLESNYGYRIPGLGLLILLLFIIAAGIFSSHFLGKKILPFFERMLMRIPFIASLYPSAKQLSDFLFKADKRKEFKKVVLVPYPVKGSYSIGFITNEGLRVVSENGAEQLVTVLVPLAPAPFSGVLLFLPKKEIKLLDISIDEAIKLIVSGGVVAPSTQEIGLTGEAG